MSKEKKSILGKLFKNSGCNCGVQIVEEEKKLDDNKKKEIQNKKHSMNN